MRNFRELQVWNKARELAKEVYLICNKLPDSEKYSMQSQLSRAAISIPSNIDEGCAKSSNKDIKRFLEISLGSAYVWETQLILAKNIYNLDGEPTVNMLQEEQKMITSLIKKLI